MMIRLMFCVALASTTGVRGQQNPNGQLPVTTLEEPLALLVRDPFVQHQLQLTNTQKKKLRVLSDRVDPDLWRSRNQMPEKGRGLWLKATATIQDQLDPLLTARQRQRLSQIRLRVRGVRGLIEPATVQSLSLTPNQVAQIQQIWSDTETKIQELRDAHKSGSESTQFQEKLKDIQSELNTALSGVLDEKQHVRWQELIGDPIDGSQLGFVDFQSPRLPTLREWINSPPLTDASLHGKVVALHFFAFGCINCIHNYPAYQRWQDAFPDQPFVLLGIHTPETPNERSFDQLRSKVKEAKFRFPVAMDRDQAVWNAWGNSMWPAVYLIDKRGRVRYWWIGELNWQGAEGERMLSERIGELLAESDEAN